jgi:hypothetical protein
VEIKSSKIASASKGRKSSQGKETAGVVPLDWQLKKISNIFG